MCSKKDKGLTNRIIEKYEQTCGTIDLCHCFNNICKYSLKKFPSELLQLVKKISSHFGSSSLRRANFREVQKDFREDEFSDFLKVLPYVSHRWSSLLKSAKRILCLWENLEVYFVQYNEKEFYSLMSPKNRLYLELLSVLLDRINSSIKYFESDNHEFSSIMPKLHETFILTAKFVLKEENCSSDDNLTLCETILGLPWGNREKLQNELKDSQTFKEYFLKKYSDFRHYSVTQKEDFEGLFPIAQEFFIEVLVQLKDRIPYTNKILNSCSAIRLQDFKAEKWKILANQFSNIVLKNNMNSVQNELDILEFNFKDLGLKLASLSQNLIVFWSSQKSDYPLLSKLALACITLSYSTVSIERTFSILRDIKTPKRNKLCFASMEACLLIHHDSKDGFQVTQEMLEKLLK